jgi:dolichyl-phosphate beta-glucosyltransferase
MDQSPEARRRPYRRARGTGEEEVGAVRKPHLLDRAPRVSDDEARPSLSVVVPAYNEEDRLGGSLSTIWTYLHDQFDDFELIVIDDGSCDGTAAIVEWIAREHSEVRLISYQPNRGKGYAVRVGILQARGEMVLFSDADLSTPIEEVESLLARIHEGSEVAIGSRAVPGALLAVRQPWYRELAGRSFNLLAQRVTPGIRDTQCGFKLFRRVAAREIFSRMEEDGFGFDAEALHIAMRLGYRIAEVPVRWVHREGSKVRLLRDSTRMFLTLLRVGRRHHALRAGNYEPSRV